MRCAAGSIETVRCEVSGVAALLGQVQRVVSPRRHTLGHGPSQPLSKPLNPSLPDRALHSAAPTVAKRTSRPKNADTTANLGFEAKLWAAADALRNNMDAAEYKHVVLGHIFLKYISGAFEAKHTELAADKKSWSDPEDPDENRAHNIFGVPSESRRQYLR